MLKKRNIYLYLLFLFIIILQGCEKEFSPIGLNTQPPEDKIIIKYDTTELILSYTFFHDSVRSDEQVMSNNLLGCYVDPVFGTAKADIITQIRLPFSDVSFGDDIQADSAVLYLKKTDYYGTSYYIDNIKVFQISNSFSATDTICYDSAYYSNFNVENYYDPSADLVVATHRDSNILAIKLSPDFTNYLISADSTDLEDNDSFLKYMQGFYIESKRVYSGGTIDVFDLLSLSSGLTLYYRDSVSSGPDRIDTLEFDFTINNNCVRINKFDFDYSNTSFYSTMDDTTIQDSVVFLQSMGGVRVKIHLPEIFHWNDSSIAVNKAELVLPVENNDLTINEYTPPDKLSLYALTSDDMYETLADASDAEYFDGNYHSDTKTYRFNIARYLQQLINGEKENYGMVLRSPYMSKSHRVVLTSGNNSERMRLYIIYTHL